MRHPGLTRRRRFAVEEGVAVWQRITSSGDHPLGAAMNPLRSCPSTGEYIIFSLSVSRHTINGNLMIGVNSVKKFEKNESIRKEAEFSHLKCFCYVYIKGMSKIENKRIYGKTENCSILPVIKCKSKEE